MKHLMRAGLAIAALASLALGGCAGSLSLPTPTDPAQVVYETKTGLVAAEDALIPFEQTICATGSSCTDSRVIAINKGIVTADAAVSAAEIAVKANSSTSTSALTAAQTAVTVLQALVAEYAPATTTAAASSAAS